MKHFCATALAACAVLNLVCTASATGEIGVRTLLSDGQLSSSNQICSDAEWEKISHTLSTSWDRRELGYDQFRYTYFPAFCANKCRGFSPGSCFMVFSACSGTSYRGRHLESDDSSSSSSTESSSSSEDARDVEPLSLKTAATQLASHHHDVIADDQTLSVVGNTVLMRRIFRKEPLCVAKTDVINKNLDVLALSLSPGCGDFVNAERDFKCWEVLDYEIVGFHLWDAKSDSVIDNTFSRWRETVCDTDIVNFEAKTGPMVETVTFNTIGDNGFESSNTERGGPPFFSFGDDDGDVKGKKLKVGAYNIFATPDDDTSRTLVESFQVIAC